MEFMACKFVNLVFVVYWCDTCECLDHSAILHPAVFERRHDDKWKIQCRAAYKNRQIVLTPMANFRVPIMHFIFFLPWQKVEYIERTPQTQGEHADRLGVGAVTKSHSIAFLL